MTAVVDTPAAARRRHPSMRCPLPVGVLRDRLATVLEVDGAPHADVAAAVLEVRGRSGLDQADFARRAGVEAALLAQAEGGGLARDELPGALRRMVPIELD